MGIDGVSLADTPWNLGRRGKHNKAVSVIVGSVRDESAMSTIYQPKGLTESAFDKAVASKVGSGNLAKVKQLYDPSVYPYPEDLGGRSIWWWMLTRIETDSVPGLGACGTRAYSRDLL